MLFGYLRVRIADDAGAATTGRKVLSEFAEDEGFALVDVFVDADENRPYSALNALIDCVRRSSVDVQGIAVAVPNLSHLGADRAAQLQMMRRVQREAQVRVLVAQL